MARTEREVVERLGMPGLTRVLNDVLDHPRLVRLANAVGLSYPGMRAQSQKKPRLVTDLADRAAREEAAGRAVVRTLRKETGPAAREWLGLPSEQRPALLRDASSRNGRLGLYLFVAASATADPAVDEAIVTILDSVAPPPPSAEDDGPPKKAESPEKEAQRLRKRCGELQKKVRYLEGQISRTKDVEKTYKRDLIQRKGVARAACAHF